MQASQTPPMSELVGDNLCRVPQAPHGELGDRPKSGAVVERFACRRREEVEHRRPALGVVDKDVVEDGTARPFALVGGLSLIHISEPTRPY